MKLIKASNISFWKFCIDLPGSLQFKMPQQKPLTDPLEDMFGQQLVFFGTDWDFSGPQGYYEASNIYQI